MLEQLHDVRWNTLRDAYGSAQPVPRLLRALAQGDRQRREDALARLWLGLCYQGSCLEEASAHAIPFLVELAGNPQVEGRGAILELVQGMAQVANRATRDLAEASVFAATRTALARELPQLLALLADGDADVRARAALTCAQVVPVLEGAGLVTLLTRALPHEPVASTRVAYVAALEEHGAHEGLRSALDDRAPAVLMAAAFALLGVDPPHERAFRIAKAALASPAQSTRLYADAASYRPLRFIARACAAGSTVAKALLPQLLPLLAESADARADEELAPLLTLFFPHGLASEPTLEQSAILSTLANHRHYFGRSRNAVRLLEQHGLPARPRPLRREALRGPLTHFRIVPKPRAVPPPDALVAEIAERELAGREPERLKTLTLVGIASDALLARLTAFPALERLCVKGSDIGADGIAALAGLSQLHTLELEDMAVDAAMMKAAAALGGLRELSLVDVTMNEDAALVRPGRPALHLRHG